MNQKLLQSLQMLASHAPKGAPNMVAAKAEISVSFLNQVKAGYKFKDEKQGEKMVRKLIAEYKKVIKKRIQTLEKVLEV